MSLASKCRVRESYRVQGRYGVQLDEMSLSFSYEELDATALTAFTMSQVKSD